MITRRLFGMSAAAAILSATNPTLAEATRAGPVLQVPSRSPFLSYEGRSADMPGGFVRASFPGVVLRINVNAAKLVLKTAATSDTVYLDVAIDGGAPRMVHLAKGQQDLVVFEGAAGAHSIEITRRTESWEGQWDIYGASLEAGTFLPAPALPAKKIMLIGDSITCGAACDVARDDDRQGATFDNAHKSYGKILAGLLGTQCHLVSYGGRGVYRDWQGIRAINNAPQFYDRAAPDEPALMWNAAAYVPDAIGICLGTNDFSQGIPDQNDFINTYAEFGAKIRRDSPNAQIFIINSPILTDDGMPKRTVCGDYLDEVVKRALSPRVVRAAIAHYPGRPSNAHPIAEEHVAIARELEPLFRAVIG